MMKDEDYIEPYSEEHLQAVKEFSDRAFGNRTTSLWVEEDVPGQGTPKVIPHPPRGTFNGGQFEAPDFDRIKYMAMVNNYARSTGYRGYKEIISPRVYFRESNLQLNLFHPDMVKILNNFLLGYKYEKLIVTQAMAVPNSDFITPHNIGMAIDVYVENEEQRNHVMNTAWSVGFPNIVQAGDATSDMHIHLDICPRAKFLYDGPYYEGPWSLSHKT